MPQINLKAPIAQNIQKALEGLRDLFVAQGKEFCLEAIGESREGRTLFAVKVGNGPLKITLTAGAHSDEPVGPLACLEILRCLAEGSGDECWLRQATWRICPQVNPDGAAKNARWFSDPLDIGVYARHVFREPPGEDVEFNYPCSKTGRVSPRPENKAVAEFLALGGSAHLHASLHGMAFAEGAWWLIGKDWVEETVPLRRQLASLFQEYSLGVHDIDRRGEKGFTRIEPGFSTTPTSTDMKDFFLRQGDEEMASRFLPSSMEFVQSLGGKPLVMVSELPLFRIFGGGLLSDPPGEETPFQLFRPKFAEARKALLEGDNGPLNEVVREFDLRPMPLETLVKALTRAVFLSAEFTRKHREVFQ